MKLHVLVPSTIEANGDLCDWPMCDHGTMSWSVETEGAAYCGAWHVFLSRDGENIKRCNQCRLALPAPDRL